MLDIAIVGGRLIDGTGADSVRADLGIRDGRIVELGRLSSSASRTIDASDQVVAPGFIDIHTHYDAQVFWDTALTPSPFHGVTTIFGGNCGFTIAPMSEPDGDYLMRMLARVEGIPVETLQQGVPWGEWHTTAEYLDRLDNTLMLNAGFFVGHSALRRVVLHEAATERFATADEIEQMKALLRAGLRAGGMGFSSSIARAHNDHTGTAVPSRHAHRDELIALSSVVREFPGTALEFIPGLDISAFPTEVFELMADMSLAADRVLNWNILQVNSQNWDLVQHQLSGGDIAAAKGGRVIALTMAMSERLRVNFRSGFVFDSLNGWDRLMALPADEKLTMLRDPAGRAEMDRLAQSSPESVRRQFADWGMVTLLQTMSPEWKRFEGMRFAVIAAELGKSPWDTLCEIVIDDNLDTVLGVSGSGGSDFDNDDASWERRIEVWRDSRAIVGGSDSGAHLDMIDNFNFPTTLLHHTTVRRSLLSLEEAVHYLTGSPAALYGLRDRGVLAVGNAADIVVFDPTTIGPGEVYTKFDIPGGAGRVYGEATGIEHVLVNGVPCVQSGELFDARPGTLLRSGRDTMTVTPSS